MIYLGDFAEDAVVAFCWNSNDADGASITRATNGTIKVRRLDDGTDCTGTSVTDTEDTPDTGIHECKIDTSDNANYTPGDDYVIWLDGAVIDGQTVNAALAQFSIENRFREVDAVKVGGSAVAAGAIPNAAAGANGGLPTVDTNNRIAGIQGTKNTLDNLNDITAAAAGTDAAGKVLATPANKLATDGDGKVTIANVNDCKADVSNLDVAVSTRSSHSAADAGTDAAAKVLATPANKLATDGDGKVTVENVNDCKADVSNLDVAVSTRSSHAAADAGTDAAGKVLATPANKLATDAAGKVTVENVNDCKADVSGLATASALSTHDGKLDLLDGVADAVKLVTDKVDDTLEDDAGTYRFTENALEQAPSGTGGDATAANQTTIINHLTDVKGTGFSGTTDALKPIRDKIDTISGGTPVNVQTEDTTIISDD